MNLPPVSISRTLSSNPAENTFPSLRAARPTRTAEWPSPSTNEDSPDAVE